MARISARRKALVGISIVILIGLAYIGSFLLLRRGSSRMMELPTSFSYAGCVEIRYFSRHPSANAALYTLYWPIRRLTGEDEGYLLDIIRAEDWGKRHEKIV